MRAYTSSIGALVVLVLAIELLFLLVFGRALYEFLRRRDPVSGDVALVFSAMAGLFGLTLLRAVTDEPPELLIDLAAIAVLAQPVLTMRLVSHLRPLPRWLLPAAVMLYVASAWPVLVYDGRLPTWSLWLAVLAFALTEGIAALYLLGESRGRTGAPRLRLQIAAASTALIAAALVVAGVGADYAARVVALLSGIGYLAAFMPPRRLRQMWAFAAAHDYGRELLTVPSHSTAEDVWRALAAAIDRICDMDAVVILGRTAAGGTRVCAAEGVDLSAIPPVEHVEFALVGRPSKERLVNEECPIETTFATAVGARFSTMVPLRPPHGGPPDHTALLLSRYRSLFSDDDLDVVADLGATAGLLAERADAAAEQARLSAQLADTVEALRVASNAKSNLLARVSHELRTPLTVIIGYSDVLKRVQAVPPTGVAADAMERIDDAGRHLLTMVDEILDVAKMDAGHVDLRPQDVDLSDLINRTIAELRPVAAHKRLSISADLTVPSVHVDPHRLRQVLYNLSSNAIKFTPEGGSIRFVSELVDDEIRISVIDDGIGIAAEHHARVFEEFTQIGVEPANSGTGLGLSIARRLVHAHGGRTELESRPGSGSRFTVVLPHWAVLAPDRQPDLDIARRRSNQPC
jgi:signal transduction histidine kinase